MGPPSSTHSNQLSIGVIARCGQIARKNGPWATFSTRALIGAARSFATAMLQAEQYGTSVSKAIRVLADESREMRMAAAEQKAAALPPKLTVPMILFFLPVLFAIILGPAGIQISERGGFFGDGEKVDHSQ